MLTLSLCRPFISQVDLECQPFWSQVVWWTFWSLLRYCTENALTLRVVHCPPPPPPPPHYIHSFYFPRFFLLVQFTTFDEHYVSSVLSLSRLSPQDVTTWLFLVLAWVSYVAFGDELIVPGVVLANKLLFEFWEDRETSPSKYVFVNRNVRLIY